MSFQCSHQREAGPRPRCSVPFARSLLTACDNAEIWRTPWT